MMIANKLIISNKQDIFKNFIEYIWFFILFIHGLQLFGMHIFEFYQCKLYI